MPRLPYTMLLAAVAGCVATAAAAQDAATPPAPPAQAAPAPAGEDARYSFHRVGDTFIRLDSRTGAVSQCGHGSAGWSCKLVPDERAALESELGRLQRDNAEMKRSLLSRGLDLPSGVVAEAPAAAPVPPADVPDPSAREPKMPSDAELDRAFAFMKHVWRRLIDMVAEIQRDLKKS
jgi:hypothetical protein